SAWFTVPIGLVGFLAGAIASVSGFGIGSLLKPVLAVRTGMKLAVAACATCAQSGEKVIHCKTRYVGGNRSGHTNNKLGPTSSGASCGRSLDHPIHRRHVCRRRCRRRLPRNRGSGSRLGRYLL